MDAEARRKLFEQAQQGKVAVDPELVTPKLNRSEMFEAARAGQLPGSQGAPREPGFLDWVKQPPQAVAKGGLEMLNLALKGLTWGLHSDEPETEMEKVMAQSTPIGNILRKGSNKVSELISPYEKATARAAKSLGDNRPVPKGYSPHADAMFTFSEWATPFGAPKKIDAGMGAVAALGQTAFGDKGENLALAVPAKSFITSLPSGLRAMLEKLTPKELKELTEWSTGQFHNKQEALDKLRKGVQMGETGDLADLAQDPGAANVLRGVQPGSEAYIKLQNAAKLRALDTSRKVEDAFRHELPDDPDFVPKPKAAHDKARQILTGQQQQARLSNYDEQSALRDQNAQVREALLTDPERAPSLLPGARAADTRQDLQKSLSREAASSQGAEAIVPRLKQSSAAVKPPEIEVAPGEPRTLTPGETSARLSNTIEEADARLREEFIDKAWESFHGSENFRLAPNTFDRFKRTLINGVPGNFAGTARGDVEEFMRREMQGLKALDMNNVRPVDLHSISSRLKQKMADPNLPRSEKRLVGNATTMIEGLIARASRGAGEYEKAKALTVQSKLALGDKPVQKAMTKDPEALGGELFVAGPEGAANARNLLATLDQREMMQPKMLEDVEQHILSRLDNELATADDGTSFLTKYDEFLNEWGKRRPEFTQKIRDYVDTQQVMNSKLLSLDATKEQERALRTKLVDEWQANEAALIKEKGKRVQSALAKSQLEQYSKKPKETIRKALLSEDGEAFSRLSNNFKTPEDKANFAAAVGEIVRDLVSKGDILTDVELFHRMQRKLKKTMGPRGLETFVRLQQEASWQYLKSLSSGVKLQGGKLERSTANDVAETLTVIAALTATKGVANPLVTTNFIRRFFRKAFRGEDKLREAEAERFLGNLLADPREFLKAVDGEIKTGSRFNEFYAQYMKKLKDKRVPERLYRSAAMQEEEGEN